MKFVRVFLCWCVLSICLTCYTWLYIPKPDSYGQDRLRFDETLGEYVVSDNGKTRVVSGLCWHAGAELRESLSVSFVSFGDKFYVFPYELDEKTAAFRGHMLEVVPICAIFVLLSFVLFVFLVDIDDKKRKIVYAN